MFSWAPAATFMSRSSWRTKSIEVRAKSRAVLLRGLKATGLGVALAVGVAVGVALSDAVGEGVAASPICCLRSSSSDASRRSGCGVKDKDSNADLTNRGTRASSTDRKDTPLNVIKAFSAVQLRLKLENKVKSAGVSKGMLKFCCALLNKRGIEAPTVALLAVSGTLMVVHPALEAVLQVFPVKPLIQTQLHEPSAFGTATPPF